MTDDMFYARVCAERDQLRAELEKLRCELDDAEERASEAEERCAAEWEKDCGQALRLLAQVTKFEWDQDGSPADEVREHIQITLESLQKQVVALRAELAAAKNLLARIHRDGGHHTEAVGFTQSVADADTKVSGWLLAADDRNALAADNARLRRALEEIADLAEEDISELTGVAGQMVCFFCGHVPHEEKCPHTIATAALAATPAQSLAAHDAALLREVARLVDDCSGEKVRAEADRIEKEAANG